MADARPGAPSGAIGERFRAALAQHQQGNLAAAARSYRDVLDGDPAHVEALHMLGVLRHQQGDHQAAVDLIRRALAIDPTKTAALLNLAPPLQRLGRHAEALATCDAALRLQPDYVNAWINRGNVLQDLHRLDDALQSYERALALRPDHAEAQYNCGNVLLDLERPAEALACFDRTLAHKPDWPRALYNRGIALQELARPQDAAESFDRLLAIDPDYPFAQGWRLHARMHAAQWKGYAVGAAKLDADVRAGKRVVEPFVYQAISQSPADLQRCAQIFAAARFPAIPSLSRGARYAHRRMRIGYVAGEFRSQATALLMTGVWERHDRDRFELYAFDNGWDDASALRQRIASAFDEIVDIASLGDRAAAQAVREREIDILVNLNGYFGRARSGIFAQRPAAIQVNYLGFPGTLGADYIDYLIADATVIPEGDERWYTEHVVRLPDSYQANDHGRTIGERVPTRAEAGLPERDFVFCCFNNTYKITPDMFAVWMRLLAGVPRSVLWLLAANADAVVNLRDEAQRHGIAPERIVFARRAGLAEHLARHRLADLFIDSLPYNAHTTASDALWAGLPVLTVRGRAFPGRVGASLLRAVGLPELIADSLDEYESMALRLAAEPERLLALRAKLDRQRASFPLFDAARFCRHLEAAYATMWEREQRGEAPCGFTVASIS